MLAGAAASDQYFCAAPLADATEIDQRKFTSQAGVNRRRFAHWRRLHPPRIGAFLVLLFDGKRHRILDGGEPRYGGLQLPLLLSIPQVARHELSHGSGPTSLPKQICPLKR